MFCRELLRRPELDAVFIRYSANSCVLSTVDLRDFLKDQAEDASVTHAQSLILTYELNEWGTVLRNNILQNTDTYLVCVFSTTALINPLDTICRYSTKWGTNKVSDYMSYQLVCSKHILRS